MQPYGLLSFHRILCTVCQDNTGRTLSYAGRRCYNILDYEYRGLQIGSQISPSLLWSKTIKNDHMPVMWCYMRRGYLLQVHALHHLIQSIVRRYPNSSSTKTSRSDDNINYNDQHKITWYNVTQSHGISMTQCTVHYNLAKHILYMMMMM